MARARLQYVGPHCFISRDFKDLPDEKQELILNLISYQKDDEVGEGINAVVKYYSSESKPHDKLAVKELKSLSKEEPAENRLYQLWHEMLPLQALYPDEGPYQLVNLQGESPMQALIMPKFPGVTLHEFLFSDYRIPVAKLMSLFHAICIEVSWLHRLDYCHGDLKGDNLLVLDNQDENNPFIIHLIDFGFCYRLNAPHAKYIHDGTSYWAPERVKPKYPPKPDTSQDIYSLACMFMQIIKKLGYEKKIDIIILNCIMRGLSIDPANRPPISEFIRFFKAASTPDVPLSTPSSSQAGKLPSYESLLKSIGLGSPQKKAEKASQDELCRKLPSYPDLLKTTGQFKQETIHQTSSTLSHTKRRRKPGKNDNEPLSRQRIK